MIMHVNGRSMTEWLNQRFGRPNFDSHCLP